MIIVNEALYKIYYHSLVLNIEGNMPIHANFVNMIKCNRLL